MYELIQLGKNTYYMEAHTKVGFYEMPNNEVCIIDSGFSKDVGRKIIKILDEKKWTLKMVFNTHSHADHVGANDFLQRRTGCKLYVPPAELHYTHYKELEAGSLYGGAPYKEIQNKFLMPEESKTLPLTEDVLPEGLEMIDLKGHSYQMTGFKTADQVYFLGDAISSQGVLSKYPIVFTYDIKQTIESLLKIQDFQGVYFVPSHGEVITEIKELSQHNIRTTYEVVDTIKAICSSPIGFDDLQKKVFDHYDLRFDLTQYLLIGSTLRSYLSYMLNENLIEIKLENNTLLYRATS